MAKKQEQRKTNMKLNKTTIYWLAEQVTADDNCMSQEEAIFDIVRKLEINQYKYFLSCCKKWALIKQEVAQRTISWIDELI